MAAGIATALAAARIMSALLYGVAPRDMLTFVLVPSLLAAVALAACVVPAWRAARIDPLAALRTE
jgi:ABC-type lipoprotein release transport system permease subunit